MAEDNEVIDEIHPHREIAEFLAEGLAKDHAVVVISTSETRRGIESHLRSLGGRPFAFGSDARVRWFDSDQILARILENGLPDEIEFEKVMEAIVINGFRQKPVERIRTYHDLVDVLRARGSLDAAVLLLRLWNNLCSRYDELLLAYTIDELYREKDCAV
jgi:hypothetical protein